MQYGGVSGVIEDRPVPLLYFSNHTMKAAQHQLLTRAEPASPACSYFWHPICEGC